MKQFTVKDFISYNNPCFSCGENIHFAIGYKQDDMDGSTLLRPTVKPEFTVVDLQTTYRDSLQLWIFHTTNKIRASNPKELEKFLSKSQLFLSSKCNKCYTNVESDYLEFDLDKSFIRPVRLFREVLMVSDGSHMYHVRSVFPTAKSFVVIDRLDKPKPISPITMEVPLLDMSRFRDKEHFFEKMKTYMIFS